MGESRTGHIVQNVFSYYRYRMGSLTVCVCVCACVYHHGVVCVFVCVSVSSQ